MPPPSPTPPPPYSYGGPWQTSWGPPHFNGLAPTSGWTASLVTYGPPIAPPPPPLWKPVGPIMIQVPRKEEDEEDRYITPDVPRLTVHYIKVPFGKDPNALFAKTGLRFDFKAYKLPLSMSIPDFFKEMGAFVGKDKVIEEAVEEGSGMWQRGAKLVWGCQDPTTIGAVRWRRGCGLKAASNQVVWILVRQKREDDTL